MALAACVWYCVSDAAAAWSAVWLRSWGAGGLGGRKRQVLWRDG
jgi:hypothetical protein